MTRRLKKASTWVLPCLSLAATSSVHAAFTAVYGGPIYISSGLNFYGLSFQSPSSTTALVLTGGGAAAASYTFYNGSLLGPSFGNRAVLSTPVGSTILNPINTSPAGAANDFAIATNLAGQTVGRAEIYNSANVSTGSHPVLWNANGSAVSLDVSAYGLSSSGSTSGFSVSLNSAATSVGYVNDYNSSGGFIGIVALRWDSSGNATPLGVLNPGTNFYSAGYQLPASINNNNVAVGYTTNYNSTNGSTNIGRTPLQWNAAGGVIAMGSPSTNATTGYSFAQPSMINDAGISVGSYESFYGSTNSNFVNRAVRWDAAGVATPLDTDGSTFGTLGASSGAAGAISINGVGQAVGFSSKVVDSGGDLTTYGVRWDAGTTTPVELGGLTTVVINGNTSYAYGINDSGIAVGYAATGASSSTRDAVMWAADGTITDLNTLIDPGSGMVLNQAYSITNTGWISGVATTNISGSNNTTSFLMKIGVSALQGVWNGSSGTWDTANNWQSNVVAYGPAQMASFGDSIGAGSATVTLANNEVVGTLAFNGTLGGNYTFNASNGAKLGLNNYRSAAVITVAAGTQTINAPISVVNGLTITAATGSTLVLGGPVTAGAGQASGSITESGTLVVGPAGSIGLPLVVNGTVTFAPTGQSTVSTKTIPTLTISSGATTTLTPAPTVAGRMLMVFGPAVALASGTSGLQNSGTLDVGNNDLDIVNGNLGTITSQIASGYSGGTWQGTGITSSAAASNHLMALGVASNNVNGTPLYGPAGTIPFDGATPQLNDVLVKYTYYGDANLDGTVNAADYTRIDNAFLGGGTGWFNGDFNYDGVINGSDYTLIDNAFNTQQAPVAALIASPTAEIAGSTTAVPEPATFSLLALGATALLGRRRRVPA